jgi:hypothetical protein
MFKSTKESHMKYRATPLVAFLAITAGASAQQPPKRNQGPDASRLVTSDIPNFWRVFDKVSLKDAAELFQREYIAPGSAGLHDLVESRIESGRYLAGTIAARPRYYTAIRASTLAVDQAATIKARASTASRTFIRTLFCPDVYFVIGRMNIVAHELIHIQQPRESAKTTLLQQALREGGAGFMGELISGGIINRVQRSYGDAHEQALWAEFQKEMRGADFSRWLFQGGRAKDRPAGLGYYIGYQICEKFYRRATDKREAAPHPKHHRRRGVPQGAWLWRRQLNGAS